jgi:hypothetical protein
VNMMPPVLLRRAARGAGAIVVGWKPNRCKSRVGNAGETRKKVARTARCIQSSRCNETQSAYAQDVLHCTVQ